MDCFTAEVIQGAGLSAGSCHPTMTPRKDVSTFAVNQISKIRVNQRPIKTWIPDFTGMTTMDCFTAGAIQGAGLSAGSCQPTMTSRKDVSTFAVNQISKIRVNQRPINTWIPDFSGMTPEVPWWF
jgi:hypothetical protein